MSINLALSRITKLLLVLGNPQNTYKSIHIAGTNGKGSTVAYISSILTAARIRNGRFTSPHLLHYNDCISINNETYPLTKFTEVANKVKIENTTNQIGCTEFELLTVTAFKIFELEKVEYAIIEVGLGGRLDATNVLIPYKPETRGGVILCGITKIGIDHENFLGSSFQEIASEKAGIIKQNIPCVLDKTNNQIVLDVIAQKAIECDSDVYLVDGNTETQFISKGIEQSPPNAIDPELVRELRDISPLKGDYQLQNLSVALQIIQLVKSNTPISTATIKRGVAGVDWPGRLQIVDLPDFPILIDGAHNESAALELKTFLDSYRQNQGLIFIMALSKGKSIDMLMKHVASKHSDTLIASKFSSPQNMPWISSYDIQDLHKVARDYFHDIIDSTNDDTIDEIISKVQDLKSKGDTRKVVVCGSLYLCSDVLRYIDTRA